MYLRSHDPHLGAVAPAAPRIVLVPGIMGSQLIESGSRRLLWGDMSMLDWAPRMSQWVASMSRGNGIDDAGGVIPGDFVRFQFPLRSIGELAARVSLSPAMRMAIRAAHLSDKDVNPYGEAMDYFVARLGRPNVLAFPYDWRLDNQHNAALLKRSIERQWGDSAGDPARPITIVAHSMGGLISRHYIEELGGNRVVRNLVTVGTPHDGAPEALRAPTHVRAISRWLLPLDVLPVSSPLALAMPALHLFVNSFLTRLQSMLLHFNSLYQLLPNRPFVYPGAAATAFEPLATSYDRLRRSACPSSPGLICSRPLSELRRLNERLRMRALSLPREVRYFAVVSHGLPTTSTCRRTHLGDLTAIQPRCGDGTVPAASAALLPSSTVRNRYLVTSLPHSDLLRERGILDLALNVASGAGALPVSGLIDTPPPCAVAA